MTKIEQLSFWAKVRVSYWSTVMRIVFAGTDTTTIRVLLAWASAVWAAFLMFDPTLFQRPAYAIMRAFSPQEIWCVAFVLHYVGVHWRLLDPRNRPVWALIVNGWGFFIWFFYTVSITLSLGAFTPGSALEWTMCGASAWALFRTGLKKEAISL